MFAVSVQGLCSKAVASSQPDVLQTFEVALL
jgi:hypothetical protein